MADWSPEQYLKFGSERTQPSIDLVTKIRVDRAESVIDIGCGPGNSTQVLRLRWPHAGITGLDSSREMIEAARESFPREKWIIGDASKLDRGESYDIVFSNAVLQWIPDHGALVPRLFSLVRRGGAMAVQVPANGRSPLHRALLSVARRPEWRGFTAGCEQLIHYHGPAYYYGLLRPLASRVELWETSYYHVLSGHGALIEWYKGSGMRPFLERLPDQSARAAFENEVLDACRPFYPVRKRGEILYPFRRLFFIAYAS